MPIVFFVAAVGFMWLSGIDGVDRLGSPWLMAAMCGGVILLALAAAFVLDRADPPSIVYLLGGGIYAVCLGMTFAAYPTVIVLLIQHRWGYAIVDSAVGIVGAIVAAATANSGEDYESDW